MKGLYFYPIDYDRIFENYYYTYDSPMSNKNVGSFIFLVAISLAISLKLWNGESSTIAFTSDSYYYQRAADRELANELLRECPLDIMFFLSFPPLL